MYIDPKAHIHIIYNTRTNQTMTSQHLLVFLLFHSFVNHTNSTIYRNQSKNSSSFRITNGEIVANMADKGLKHLVRMFAAYEYVDRNRQPILENHHTIDELYECTGMKVTLDQLLDEPDAQSGLADARYVLTAAHCVEPTRIFAGGKRLEQAQIRQVFVVSGQEHVPKPERFVDPIDGYYYSFKSIKFESIRTVEKFSRKFPGPKGYNSEQIAQMREYNDLAILKLNSPFTVERPSIPLEFNEDDANEGEKCRVAGWGIDQTGQNDDNLKIVEEGIELLNKEQCVRKQEAMLKSYPRPTGFTDELWRKDNELVRKRIEVKSDTVLCTLHRSGRMPCYGDSGAPLMCRTKTGEIFGPEKIRGITTDGPSGVSKVPERILPDGTEVFKVSKHECDELNDRVIEMVTNYVNLSGVKTKTYIRQCVDALQKQDAKKLESIRCKIHVLEHRPECYEALPHDTPMRRASRCRINQSTKTQQGSTDRTTIAASTVSCRWSSGWTLFALLFLSLGTF